MTILAIIIVWILIFAQIVLFIKSFDKVFADSTTLEDYKKAIKMENIMFQ